MSIVRITKEFHFEGAHALIGYDGKCRHIHGHSYKLYVSLKGLPSSKKDCPKNGMLMDFTVLKEIVNTYIISVFDHSLAIPEGAPLADELAKAYDNVILLPFQPTCENLVTYFATLLKDKLPQGIELFSLKLHETQSSYAEWFSQDNQ